MAEKSEMNKQRSIDRFHQGDLTDCKRKGFNRMSALYKNRYKLFRINKNRYIFAFLILLPIFACVNSTPKKLTKFDHVKCMDTVPSRIKGLRVLSGPRTEKSIIHDMVPVNCYAQVLFRKMQSDGEDINAGDVIFRVTVEYTGEAYTSSVEETTIRSKRFIQSVADMIMNHDFGSWARHSEDSVFLYPMSFGG